MLTPNQLLRWKTTLAVWLLAGCGSAPPQAATPEELPQSTPEVAAPEDDGLAVEGLRGTIPEGDVRKTVEGNMGSFLQCYEKGYEINDGIEGTVELVMEVGSRGNVLSAFVQRSDLGALVTEQCIVRRAGRLTFPPTQGGGNAEVSYGFEFQAPYELPQIEKWDASRFDETLLAYPAAIESCTNGQRGITLTIFVNKDGSTLTAGAASNTLDAYDSATCLAELATTWRLEAPSADLAKASLYF